MSVSHRPKVSNVPCHNALRPDVNPTARGHLAIHHQLCAPAREMVPVGHAPTRFEFAIKNARARIRACEKSRRFCRLNQQRFVVLKILSEGTIASITIPSCARLCPRRRKTINSSGFSATSGIEIVHQAAAAAS